ncbi:hypothetical protein EUGRSUZ_F01347 [Eucalyptus grandis]|uniref:Uncharacterized protein n=2 Tax=Eucalyptus grandis TaxID=71139 RepID=A0ACC3KDK8_EUCGR|nr:hypothetical protein EUGRSUZ_F01347 [Eucalyptus grandis]
MGLFYEFELHLSTRKPIDWSNPEGAREHIHSLAIVNVEGNWLSGRLPPELGKLSELDRLSLTSNNFTGELPQTFANFTELWTLRLGDNQFRGKIPSFIQNLTSLRVLIIQGSGLQGPIPSGIAVLERLTYLRISDLNGPESPVPKLRCRNIVTLILRSCNLMGELPAYLAQMTNLKIL